MQEKDNKKYISPEKPADLLTCSAYIARDLVAQYFKMKVLNMRDAVALYIISGYVEFKRDGDAYFESEASIARALGLEGVRVRRTVGDLIEAGFITRDGKNGDKLRDRPWKVPILKPDNGGTVGADTVPQSDGSPSPSATDTVPHSDGGTVPHSDGHLKESGSELKNEVHQVGRKGKKPPASLTKDSSFKKRSDTEIQTMLDSFPWEDYLVDAPNGLAGCFTDIIGIWKSPSEAKVGRDEGSANIIDPMDEKRAFKTLEQMGDLKTRDRICKWLKWYIQNMGLEKSLYITDFSASWKEYQNCETAQKKAQYEKESNERHEKWVNEAIMEINKCPQIIKVMDAVGEFLEPETMENILPNLADLAHALLADPPCIVTDPEVNGLIADIKERENKFVSMPISRFESMVEKRREAMMTGVATD